jgi:hypothetical protein
MLVCAITIDQWPDVESYYNSQIIGAGVLGGIIVVILLLTLHLVDVREMIASTELYPSNEANPSIPRNCNVPENALKVFLGNSLAWASEMPRKVIDVSNTPMLVIDTAGDQNKLKISILRLFDDKGDIIARIENNLFLD